MAGLKFTIIHPTARVSPEGFKLWWFEAQSAAMAACDQPSNVEYLVVVHHSRAAQFWSGLAGCNGAPHKWGRFTVIVNRGRDCLVDQSNAAHIAMQGEIIVGNQDDMRFPEHWDSEICKLVPDASQLACVQAKTTGPRKDLLTVPTIATYALCQAIGPISPEYDGMYSDDEWSLKARQFGKVIQSDLYFQHMHPAWGPYPADEIHAKENREEAYRIGRAVFERRKALGFPRVELPGDRVPTEPDVRQAGEYDAPPEKPSLIKRALRSMAALCEVSAPAPALRRSVVACLPGKDYERLGCVLNLVGAAQSMGFDFKTILGYASSPDSCREMIAKDALHYTEHDPAQYPYVFWQDDDNITTPEQLIRLVGFLENNPHADLIVGWCWIRRNEGWTTSLAQFTDDMGARWLSPQDVFGSGDAPQPVNGLASGFPCVLMRREVLERIGGEGFRKIPAPKSAFGCIGEDFSFMWRAWRAGVKCYFDPACKVAHLKVQPQEPDLMPFVQQFPKEVQDARRAINGNPVDIPQGFMEHVS